MKQKRGQQELGSLIPSVRNTEEDLNALMTETRERAERAVADAETRAREILSEAQAALPAVLAAERETEMRRLREEAEDVARAEKGRTEALELYARAVRESAVAYVVSRVWPGGGG